jgi:hypothetical protein
VVEPLDFESNRILVLAKPELTEFLSHLASGKVLYHTYFKQIFLSFSLSYRFKNVQEKLQSSHFQFAPRPKLEGLEKLCYQ